MARGAERRALGPPPDLERVRERSLSLAEAAADERGEDGQEGLQEAAADQDLSELYRNLTVARALADALAQLSREEDVPMEVLGATMGAFDKAILRSTEQARHLACRAKVEGELEAYSNVYERWQLVVRGAKAVQTEANTPLEPDRTLPLRPGAALDITGVDDQHCVQGNSFRRKGAGAGGGGGKRGLPPGL